HVGDVHESLGHYPKALELQERAAAEAESLGARDTLYSALLGVARTRLRSGEPREAAAVARRATQVASQLASRLAEEQGARARGVFGAVYEVGAVAAAKSADTGDVAFFLESGRAGALIESLKTREALRDIAVPPTLRDADTAARAAETSATSALRQAHAKGDAVAAEVATKNLKTARAQVEDVVARIQRSGKAAQIVYPEPDSLEAIRGRLHTGEALVL